MSNSPGDDPGAVGLNRFEPPITWRSYLICGFASFGGMLFGYDSGYISGVLAIAYVKRALGSPVSTDIDPTGYIVESWQKSLVTSILSAGTFFGALFGGEISERIGRRTTIMIFCLVYAIGVAVQTSTTRLGTLVAGRVVGGLGVGGTTATIVLYVSEISPRKIRGVLVSVYQWAVTIGLLIASGIDMATKDLNSRASYRIPIGIQLVWAFILAAGLFILPESPRYYVKTGRLDEAAKALSRVRGQPTTDPGVQAELAEVKANYDYEMGVTSSSWLDCFRGGFAPRGNLRRVFVGTSLQMLQQWTGINFIFYYGTTFFQQAGLFNPFVIALITNAVNTGTTPASFWMIEHLGRRGLLLWGAVIMCVCEFIIAIVGVASVGRAVNICLIVFVCLYIAAFATTWGPAAWVVIGEIYPLPIRAKGVALATASNWLWNCVIAVITPYMVDRDKAALGVKVFFVWGGALVLCFLFTFFFVPETKGLTLEQIDQMLEESSPIKSSKWRPHETFAKRSGDIKGRREEPNH